MRGRPLEDITAHATSSLFGPMRGRPPEPITAHATSSLFGPMRGRPPEAGRHLYNVVEYLWKMSNYTWKTTLKTIFVVFFHFIMVLLDGLSANHPKFASYIASSKFRYLE